MESPSGARRRGFRVFMSFWVAQVRERTPIFEKQGTLYEQYSRTRVRIIHLLDDGVNFLAVTPLRFQVEDRQRNYEATSKTIAELSSSRFVGTDFCHLAIPRRPCLSNYFKRYSRNYHVGYQRLSGESKRYLVVSTYISH